MTLSNKLNIWLLIHGLLLLSKSAAKKNEYDHEKEEKIVTNVFDLTDETFKNLLTSTDRWLVIFHAPWSEIYRHFLLDWIGIADLYLKRIKVGSINAIKYMHTGDMNEISTYPTIKYFPKLGKDVATAKLYSGKFVKSDVITWIENVKRE